MAVSHCILSVSLYTLSILALTVDRPSFLNREATTNTTLPLNLLHLASLHTSLTTCPPIRWQYDDGSYQLSIYRGPIRSSTKTKDNPGVSLHNWGVAVDKAIKALEDESESAGVTMFDPMPGGRFHYATLLDKGATIHRQSQRKLIFDILKRSADLLYIEAKVILTGLLEYTQEWKTGASGLPKDEVRMCRFDLHLRDDGKDIFIADGTVSLMIPSGNNGPPLYVGSLASSLPLGYS